MMLQALAAVPAAAPRAWPTAPSPLMQFRPRLLMLAQTGSSTKERDNGAELVYMLLLLSALAFAAIALTALCSGYGFPALQPRQEDLSSIYRRGQGSIHRRCPGAAGTPSPAACAAGAFQERWPASSPICTPRPLTGRLPQTASDISLRGASPKPSLLTGPSPRVSMKGGKRPATSTETPSPPLSPQHVLCPCLMVPEGMELVFAVREMLTKDKQRISFSIVDLEGKPLSHVIVNETGFQCGIHMQLLDKTPLAWVRTSMLHEKPRGVPQICLPTGQAFCTLEPTTGGNGKTRGYELRDTAGRCIYSLQGDFKEKAINVMNSKGDPICTTERCLLSFDTRAHYKVRVAPCVDAGLLLCALLAVDKLEGTEASDFNTQPDDSPGAFAACNLSFGRRPGTVC